MISWKQKKSFGLSTCKAEFKKIVLANQEVLYIKALLEILQDQISETRIPPPNYSPWKSIQHRLGKEKKSSNPPTVKTIKYQFIDETENRYIFVEYIRGRGQVVGILPVKNKTNSISAV